MEGERRMSVGIYILNFNGRELLAECLPSVIRAADRSRHRPPVIVIDNDSTDDSLAWLAVAHPMVRVIHCANRGLCSYNDVLADSADDVAVLLNSDIKLDDDCVDRLVEPLLPATDVREDGCFMTAPLALRFDGRTYEGFRTAVGWRWGLVQATALFPGHERRQLEPGPTASVGAALAVDRKKFLELGGFDPLYLPGRIEDLDLCYRAFQAGWQIRYVPAAVVYHRGQATFDRELGDDTSRLLALRNTLLFQWKHLRHPAHLARQAAGLSLRLATDLMRLPMVARSERLIHWRALGQAFRRVSMIEPSRSSLVREREFFEMFAPARMADQTSANVASDRRHPLSRWYLCPLADRVSRALVPTSVRPWHFTLAGLLAGVLAAALILLGAALPIAALCVLLAWFLDRVDGQLARAQRTASARGAWFDANVDELLDLGLQACVAFRAAEVWQSSWPWFCLVAFLFGKYLLMYGLAVDEPSSANDRASGVAAEVTWKRSWLKSFYHLPGNADIRVHVLAAALLTGWLLPQLAAVAVYYNFRWIARYLLVARRPQVAWGGSDPA
jgi:GT2 family glycosyltransferase/phosphatidylglycerophosphate synthase